MRKGIRPETEQRYTLLGLLMNQNMSLDMIEEITRPMAGKLVPEKEKIAAELIARYGASSKEKF